MLKSSLSWTNRLESLAENKLSTILLLFLLSLFFYVGIGSVHLFDWDEINFAESAREMIESQNYLRVQINYLPFWEKPPFFFWLQVLSMKLFGVTEFAARFPNALLGFIYMATLYLIGRKHYSGKFGLMWAFLFAGSLLPQVYFKSGIIDPLFNYFIFLSIYFMIRSMKDNTSDKLLRFAFLAGLFSGLSVITKGPVGFLLFGLTLFIFILSERFKSFPSLKKIGLFLFGFLIIATGWLSLEVAQNGFDILKQFIAYQADLFSRPVAGHAQPFYYHFVVILFGCFPISALAIPSLFRRNTSNSSDYLLRINQILFWSVLILFSIVTTKIIHYSSMTYLPLAFIATYQLYNFDTTKVSRWLYLVTAFIVILGFTVVPFLFIYKEWLYPIMNDEFALRSFKDGPTLSFFHLFYAMPLIIGVFAGFKAIKKLEYIHFSLINFVSTSLAFALVMIFLLPKIEQTTQGPAIEFSKEPASVDCYYDAIGFKSYIPYFYGQTPYREDKRSKDIDWLIDGPVDKPVYFLAKYDYDFLNSRPQFRRLHEKGGYVLWKREIPQ